MTGKKRDYLILVEHVARELDIACLIKYYIEKQTDIQVYIASLPYYKSTKLKNIHPEVIAVPFFYEQDFYKFLLSEYPNATFVNLAYEQIFQKVNDNLKSPKDKAAKKSVIHHAWSEESKKYWVSYGVNPDNITVNGNLSYYLYKYPYKKYFKKRDELAPEFNLDPSKKWIFFPENYGAAFYTDGLIQYKISQGVDPTDIFNYREFAQKSFREIIQWCIDASVSANCEIILRPRPATSKENMKKFITDVEPHIPPNLKIIKDLSVKEWILASDITVSSYSTTLIEAAVAGKPVYILEPLPFPEYLYASWYDMVPKIVNNRHFLEMFTSNSHKASHLLQQWAETGMMKNHDALYQIAKILIDSNTSNLKIPKKTIEEKNLEKIQEMIKTNIKRAVRIIRRETIDNDYDSDCFTEKDVLRRVKRWQEVLEG